VERRKAIDAGLLALHKCKSQKMLDLMKPEDENRLRVLAELEYKTPTLSDTKNKFDASEMLKAVSMKNLHDAESVPSDSGTSFNSPTKTAESKSVFSPISINTGISQKKKKKKKQINGYESKFESGDLWSPVSKVLTNCSVAFSESSIASASAQGLYDEVGIIIEHARFEHMTCCCCFMIEVCSCVALIPLYVLFSFLYCTGCSPDACSCQLGQE
jgi:hypothetical protein